MSSTPSSSTISRSSRLLLVRWIRRALGTVTAAKGNEHPGSLLIHLLDRAVGLVEITAATHTATPTRVLPCALTGVATEASPNPGIGLVGRFSDRFIPRRCSRVLMGPCSSSKAV